MSGESEMEINNRNAIIHLNKAAVLLELSRFHEAYNEAESAIKMSLNGAVINEEKALYRSLFSCNLQFYRHKATNLLVFDCNLVLKS